MIALVEISCDSLARPLERTRLATLAAEHDVVLTCAFQAMAGGALERLYETLPRGRMVAVLIDAEVPGAVRRLTSELLDEGTIPLIITTGGPATGLTNWHWLGAGICLALS